MSRAVRILQFSLAAAFALAASDVSAAVLLSDPSTADGFDCRTAPLSGCDRPAPIHRGPMSPAPGDDLPFSETALLPGGSAGGMGGSSRGVAPPATNAVAEDAEVRVAGGRLVYGLRRESRSPAPASFSGGIFRPPRAAC